MNAEATRSTSAQHKLTLEGREKLALLGVVDVISFDDQNVMLNTVCGNLQIEGASLHIHVLDLERGIVEMDGRIDSMIYYESANDTDQTRSGFFGKLFR